MRRMILKVKGMSCAHCERRVSDTLTALPGVSVLKVSAAEEQVLLDMEEKNVSEADLKEAVESAGYRVP